ncbi:MAG: hypothetical protein AB4290_17640 [Spirulina sp.]
MRTPAWFKDFFQWLSRFVSTITSINPGLQIGEMFLGLLLLVPGILGLFYLLWFINPLLALLIEFGTIATLLLLALKMFNMILNHS